MATKCYSPILGKRIRVTELDECGNITPTSRQLTTDGFITVTLSAEVEEGTEILVRNAAGNICVNEKSNDSFKRFGVELEFCGVNPSLMAMVTNAQEYEDYAGEVAGFTVAEGEITGKFALEIWTGLSGQACGSGGEEASGYLLLPLVVSGTMGDFSLTGEDAATFSLANSYTKGGNNWGVGPYDVLMDNSGEPEGPGEAAPLPLALDPLDHLLLMDTELSPPPQACTPEVVAAP